MLDGGVRPASIHVAGGRIAALGGIDEVPPGASVLDVGNDVVMPGVVDAHVHINEPGRTEWEGFETATRAAAKGGITTVVDMPLNCIPVTTTAEAAAQKEREAHGRCHVDYAFWGGVVPDNATSDGRTLEAMLDAGVPGFKCFLVHSGVDDFPNVVEDDLRRAMPVLARRKSVLLVHAELPGPIDAAAERLKNEDPRRYETFLASRPRASEDLAIEMMVRLCRDTGCAVHVVHLSSSNALETIENARREGLPITAETCPHYLTFAAEEIEDGGTPFKCCPPIREAENREKLWGGLAASTISQVVSDHSPCTPVLKKLETGDFMDAWGGIAGLQFGLSSVWTEASRRGHDLVQLVEWMCRAPARLACVDDRKGSIAVGLDADLVVFDPDRTFVVDPANVEHRHKLTPWAGRTLRGVVERTILRGEDILAEREPRGSRLLARR